MSTAALATRFAVVAVVAVVVVVPVVVVVFLWCCNLVDVSFVSLVSETAVLSASSLVK